MDACEDTGGGVAPILGSKRRADWGARIDGSLGTKSGKQTEPEATLENKPSLPISQDDTVEKSGGETEHVKFKYFTNFNMFTYH